MSKNEISCAFLLCVNKYTEFLPKAIDSILNQNDKDFLFYIIANNCDDELWNFINSYNDKRIKACRTKVGQLTFNLNYGLNIIEADYILRMDADDISMPNRLELTKKQLLANKYPDVLSGSFVLIDEDDNEISTDKESLSSEEIKSMLWLRNKICHPSVAINRKSLLNLGGYSWGFNSEDYDLWVRMSRSASSRLIRSEDVFLKYRISPGQTRAGKLPYSEVAALMLREFLYSRSVKYFFGFVVAVLKRYIKAK